MFIMLVMKCVPQQTYTTTSWKQRNLHPKGLKCSLCWSLNVCRNRHTPLLPGNNESICVTAFVRLAGTVISMAIVIQRG